jgi:hypothetical protein
VPAHVFCNDFDSSTVTTYGWSSDYVTPPDGTQVIDTSGLAKSAPNCLYTKLVPPAAGAFSAASVNRMLDAPTAGTVMRFEADLRFDSTPYASNEGTLLMKIQRTGGKGIGFGIDPDGFYVELVGTTYQWTQLTVAVPSARWFRVRIEGNLKVTGGTAQVWIDGVSAGTFAGSTVDVEGTSRNYVVGLYADAPTSAFGVRFDNVTVDYP